MRTPSNFGTQGDRPSHPELLDYLAARFVAEGWSHQETASRDHALGRLRSSAPQTRRKEPRGRSRQSPALARQPPAPRCRSSARRSALCLRQARSNRRAAPPCTSVKTTTAAPSTASSAAASWTPLSALFDFPNPNSTSEQRMRHQRPAAAALFHEQRLRHGAGEGAGRARRTSGPDDAARIDHAYRLSVPALAHSAKNAALASSLSHRPRKKPGRSTLRFC